MWELAIVITNISGPGPSGYQVSGLWLAGRRYPGLWLDDSRYQCRTLIITFLLGLNIITCLHLSHPGHSNIGSLILANKCLLALLHHNTISTFLWWPWPRCFVWPSYDELLMWWCYLVWLSDQHSGRYWLTLGIITQHYPAIYHEAPSN